ncbi:hypothetical protein BC628DRAFT_1289851, partial [Trametes gibbosa]
DVSETFAIIFTGTNIPTVDEYKRTPFIVRHRVVLAALRWLKLNHIQYHGITVSTQNMQQYEDNAPPVYVIHRQISASENNLPVYETADAKSHPSGEECPFMVHTLSAAELGEMTYKQRLAYAIRYFDNGGNALGVGHEETPESMYHNENLYPGMYPWLYPYGLGGFENTQRKRRLDPVPHLRANLLYGD